jgi:hypothetical protein
MSKPQDTQPQDQPVTARSLRQAWVRTDEGSDEELAAARAYAAYRREHPEDRS